MTTAQVVETSVTFNNKPMDLFTDTAAILNLLDLRSIMGCPGGTRSVFTRTFRTKRELQCIFLGEKAIIITSKHCTTIFFFPITMRVYRIVLMPPGQLIQYGRLINKTVYWGLHSHWRSFPLIMTWLLGSNRLLLKCTLESGIFHCNSKMSFGFTERWKTSMVVPVRSLSHLCVGDARVLYNKPLLFPDSLLTCLSLILFCHSHCIFRSSVSLNIFP